MLQAVGVARWQEHVQEVVGGQGLEEGHVGALQILLLTNLLGRWGRRGRRKLRRRTFYAVVCVEK